MHNHNNELITIKQVFSFFWRSKFIVMLITGVFAAFSVFWTLQLPDRYESKIMVVASETESLSNLSSQLGGLASLTGINLNSGGSNQASIALEVINSRWFVAQFIKNNKLLPELLASIGWNKMTGELIYDETAFDPANNVWVRQAPKNKAVIPTAWEGHNAFIQSLKIEHEPKSGVINLSFEHFSPTLSRNVVANLVTSINQLMRQEAITESKKSIEFLKKEIQKTTIAELKTVFYGLIEEQTKKLMLAQVRDDYIFKVVSEPVLPEDKSNPKRAFLCAIITFVGFLVSLLLSLAIDAYRHD